MRLLLRAWHRRVVRCRWRRGLATGLAIGQVTKRVAAILILTGLLLKRWKSGRLAWRRRLLLLLLGGRRVGVVPIALAIRVGVLLILVGIHTAYGTGGRWWGLPAGGHYRVCSVVVKRIHRKRVPTG